MEHNDGKPIARRGLQFWRFLRALTGDWITLVSSIASVALSILAASSKTNLPAWTFWVAAGVSFLFASFRVWTKENRALTELLQEQPPRIEVHGIPTVRMYGKNFDRHYIIVPDVTITTLSRRTDASIGVEMWIRMTGAGEANCAPEAVALTDWETDVSNYRNQHLSFPLNLRPRHTVNGYIACVLQTGLIYDRPLDENGLRYFPCRIVFKDYLTEPVKVIYSQDIKFYV